MSQTAQLGGALLALLLALPLISYGMSTQNSVLWWVGLFMVIVGAGTPICARLLRGDSCSEATARRLWGRLKDQVNQARR